MAISQWQHVQKKHIEKNTLLLLAVDFSLKKTPRAPKHRAPLFLMVSLLTTKLGRVAKFLWPAQRVVKLTSGSEEVMAETKAEGRLQGWVGPLLDLRLFGCWKKWSTKKHSYQMVVNFMVMEFLPSRKNVEETSPTGPRFPWNSRWFPETKKLRKPWEPRSVRSIIWPDPIYKQPKSPVIWNFSAFFGRTFNFGILACSSTENGFMEPFKTMRLMSVTGHPNHSLTIWLDVYGFGWRLWFGGAWVTGPKDHPVVSISGGSLARGHCWWVPLRIGLFSSPFFKWP